MKGQRTSAVSYLEFSFNKLSKPTTNNPAQTIPPIQPRQKSKSTIKLDQTNEIAQKFKIQDYIDLKNSELRNRNLPSRTARTSFIAPTQRSNASIGRQSESADLQRRSSKNNANAKSTARPRARLIVPLQEREESVTSLKRLQISQTYFSKATNPFLQKVVLPAIQPTARNHRQSANNKIPSDKQELGKTRQSWNVEADPLQQGPRIKNSLKNELSSAGNPNTFIRKINPHWQRIINCQNNNLKFTANFASLR